MPQRSYEWSAIDYATASEIANLINDAHLIARDVVRLSENRLRYSRVRDLMTAEKAPARLSELFTICAIVGVSPVWESRDVPIPDKLLPLLQNTLKGLGKDDLVFTDPDGHSIRQQHTGSGSNNWWSRALDSADLDPMRIHDLRHTAASIAVSAGANVKALQNMLGHKSAAMTLDTYADLFDSDLEALGENINAKIPDLEVAA